MDNPFIITISERLRAESRVAEESAARSTQSQDKLISRARIQYETAVRPHIEDFVERMLDEGGRGAQLYCVLDRPPVWSHAPWMGKFAMNRHRFALSTSTEVPGWLFGDGNFKKPGHVPIREKVVVLATGKVAVEQRFLSRDPQLFQINENLYDVLNLACDMRTPDAVQEKLQDIERSF